MTDDLQFQEQAFDAGEVTINYAENANENGGTSLLLLYGVTFSWRSGFDRLLPALAQSRHTYAPDLRGHGGSGHASSYRTIDYAKDFESLLLNRINEPVVVIGFDIGALVAMLLAASVPDLVQGVVLIEPLLHDEEIPKHHKYLDWCYEASSASTREEVTRIVKESSPFDEEQTPEQVQMDVDDFEPMDPRTVEYIQQVRFNEGFDYVQTIRGLRCPALLICGEFQLGGFVNDDDKELFTSTVADSKVVTLAGVGHEVIWNKEAQVTLGHIRDFLDSLS